MPVQKIIQEAINKSPRDLKEALEEELRNRIRLALEAKMDDEDDDDSSEEDEDEKDMKEDLDEAVKIGSRVKIHAPGKDYHGHIGSVGEIRKRSYGTNAPSYTVDYYKPGSDHRHSVTLDKKQIKLHKEPRGLLDAKESFDLLDYSIEELETFMESPEFDQLDEISKKTLGSYVSKAADKAALHGMGYGEKKAQSDEMDRVLNRHMSFSDKDKVRSIMKTSMKDVEEPREKMVKRLRGISTAAKKLSGGARVPAGDK